MSSHMFRSHRVATGDNGVDPRGAVDPNTERECVCVLCVCWRQVNYDGTISERDKKSRRMEVGPLHAMMQARVRPLRKGQAPISDGGLNNEVPLCRIPRLTSLICARPRRLSIAMVQWLRIAQDDGARGTNTHEQEGSQQSAPTCPVPTDCERFASPPDRIPIFPQGKLDRRGPADGAATGLDSGKATRGLFASCRCGVEGWWQVCIDEDLPQGECVASGVARTGFYRGKAETSS